jgi:hypothetical protein
MPAMRMHRSKIEKSWFMLLEIYRYIMSPIVKGFSNKISPINPQIFAYNWLHVRNTLFRMKSNLNSLNNSRNCQNKSNMRRCDRKCVLSVILRHLSVNIFATKYVIFYRILWRHSWSKMHHLRHVRLALVSICEIDVTSFSEDGRGVK